MNLIAARRLVFVALTLGDAAFVVGDFMRENI
jgi:hypothetical protein